MMLFQRIYRAIIAARYKVAFVIILLCIIASIRVYKKNRYHRYVAELNEAYGHIEKGQYYNKNGRYDDAIREYKKASEYELLHDTVVTCIDSAMSKKATEKEVRQEVAERNRAADQLILSRIGDLVAKGRGEEAAKVCDMLHNDTLRLRIYKLYFEYPHHGKGIQP